MRSTEHERVIVLIKKVERIYTYIYINTFNYALKAINDILKIITVYVKAGCGSSEVVQLTVYSVCPNHNVCASHPPIACIVGSPLIENIYSSNKKLVLYHFVHCFNLLFFLHHSLITQSTCGKVPQLLARYDYSVDIRLGFGFGLTSVVDIRFCQRVYQQSLSSQNAWVVGSIDTWYKLPKYLQKQSLQQ